MYYVVREGEIIGCREFEEEAQEIYEDDINESTSIVKEQYELDDDTSEEEIAYLIGRDMGYPYIMEVDVDSLDEDEVFVSDEGDEFSKEELEEWLET